MYTVRFAVWLVLIAVYLLAGWVPGLLLTIVALVEFLVRAVRLRRALRPYVLCPRNHVVPIYGLFRCGACGAVTESWAWRCPHCFAESGYVACPTCGLSVANPTLRG